ncbi:DUF1398 domain-containing protein [Mucilaginibacter terrigena]|uniref:DUF1398 domain-containing protein n=1 Tax=Mucilaginibacter terrigena TaxID=2492395 RepID=A0A4Q5LIJ0_9SPHI|nr:DUF1398 family protein [Mucilaginibacter terrigena]RYU88000.1 DUF1398 domain-containing protein [Mucilaginibacter terrigena]
MTNEEKLQEAYATAKNYPDLAAKLAAAGIQSYVVDVATKAILYRLNDGVTILHNNGTDAVAIARDFNRELVIKAIRDNQQGKTTYPHFMQGIADAGVRIYEATLTGSNKRVNYIGLGGFYEEQIPG